MVLYKEGKVYFKIVYWGTGSSGKTAILKTLYTITKEKKRDIIPIGELQIMEKDTGGTLYFDRGLFQFTEQTNAFFRVYTVAGQEGFFPLRKKIFDRKDDQTDAVILVVDSQAKFLDKNIEALLELKKMARNRLINEIPMIVMLNKHDLDEVINEEDFKLVLKENELWYDPEHELHIWNPIIYPSCAIFGKHRNIYRSFYECINMLFHCHGSNNLPYPYIFKPPPPPDDFAMTLPAPVREKKLENEYYCQYCGQELTDEEQITHICKDKPKTT